MLMVTQPWRHGPFEMSQGLECCTIILHVRWFLTCFVPPVLRYGLYGPSHVTHYTVWVRSLGILTKRMKKRIRNGLIDEESCHRASDDHLDGKTPRWIIFKHLTNHQIFSNLGNGPRAIECFTTLAMDMASLFTRGQVQRQLRRNTNPSRPRPGLHLRVSQGLAG